MDGLHNKIELHLRTINFMLESNIGNKNTNFPWKKKEILKQYQQRRVDAQLEAANIKNFEVYSSKLAD